MKIDEILKERGQRYGDFTEHARISQSLKDVVWHECKEMRPFQKEALEMILHKVARIINGDPDYDDSWKDIAGYAQLVVDRLKTTAPPSPGKEV